MKLYSSEPMIEGQQIKYWVDTGGFFVDLAFVDKDVRPTLVREMRSRNWSSIALERQHTMKKPLLPTDHRSPDTFARDRQAAEAMLDLVISMQEALAHQREVREHSIRLPGIRLPEPLQDELINSIATLRSRICDLEYRTADLEELRDRLTDADNAIQALNIRLTTVERSIRLPEE